MFGTIIKIVGMKPVQDLLSALTRKLLGPKGEMKSKVGATVGAGVIVAALIGLAKWLDPGLGAILAGHEATLIGLFALVTAIIQYYTPERVQ
jgi:hypothetical protein